MAKGLPTWRGKGLPQELGLPVNEQGRVLHPDPQLEYTDAEGRTRVNIEVASGHYRNSSILAKSEAGFALHATGQPECACSKRWAVAGVREMTAPKVPPKGTRPPLSCKGQCNPGKSPPA